MVEEKGKSIFITKTDYTDVSSAFMIFLLPAANEAQKMAYMLHFYLKIES